MRSLIWELVNEFQYPLRANGLRSCRRHKRTDWSRTISVPSTGQWIEKPWAAAAVAPLPIFQYPLRANGLRSGLEMPLLRWHPRFQYPLRANGLRSPLRRSCGCARRGISVPSTGQWIEKREGFHIQPCHQCISVPSTGQWIEKHLWTAHDTKRSEFQYPLRANGLRSTWQITCCNHWLVFQYPLRANGLRSTEYPLPAPGEK